MIIVSGNAPTRKAGAIVVGPIDQIVEAEYMTPATSFLVAVYIGYGGGSAFYVFGLSYRFQVPRINTQAIPTQVVEHQPLFDIPENGMADNPSYRIPNTADCGASIITSRSTPPKPALTVPGTTID